MDVHLHTPWFLGAPLSGSKQRPALYPINAVNVTAGESAFARENWDARSPESAWREIPGPCGGTRLRQVPRNLPQMARIQKRRVCKTVAHLLGESRGVRK